MKKDFPEPDLDAEYNYEGDDAKRTPRKKKKSPNCLGKFKYKGSGFWREKIIKCYRKVEKGQKLCVHCRNKTHSWFIEYFN